LTEDLAPRPPSLPTTDVHDRPALLENASKGRLIAVLLMIAVFSEVVPFQYSMAGVITPLVAESFPSAGDSVSWMVTIIGLVGGGTMALLARMADQWGKKRMLVIAGVLFLIGSLVCAVTTSWPVFLAGRACQATALGMAALGYSLVRDIMPRAWIPISIGFIGTGLGLSAVLGPLIGGILTDHFSWRSIFWFLTVYMAVSLVLFLRVVPESDQRSRRRLDFVGALLIGFGLAAILLYVTQGESWGWTEPSCYGYLLAGIGSLLLYAIWQSRITDPIMDLSLLRVPRVFLIMAMSFVGTAVLAVLAFLPAYMFLVDGHRVQQAIIGGAAQKAHVPPEAMAKAITFQGDISFAQGYSLLEAAVRIILFMSVTAMIFGPLGGLWIRRSNSRHARSSAGRPLIASAVLFLVASAGLVVWHDTWQSQALFGTIYGMAYGLFYAGLPNLVIDTVTQENQAISAGMTAVFGAIGSSFGIAIATAILVQHPFQFAIKTRTGQEIINKVPHLYTNGGFGQAYLYVGVGGSVIALLIALALWSTRPAAH
jgi:MFS family permease